MNYSTPCDICGTAAGIEGLKRAGSWPNGDPFRAHPSCIDMARDAERDGAPFHRSES